MSSFHMQRKEPNPCRRCGRAPTWNDFNKCYQCSLCEDPLVKAMFEELVRKEAARNVWNDANPKRMEGK